MTDVIPDEIQPDGSGSSDPGPEATLEVSPSAAAAAEPAMPSVSEAAASAAETATPAEISSAEASSIETAAAAPAAGSTAALSSPAAPEPAAQASGDSPSLEASTSVPPAAGDTTAASGGEGGGEWELLLAKLQGWLGSGQLQELWSQARRPLNLVLAAVALLLVLRVYTGLIEAINGLPLVAGLLELVGLIWAVRCGLPRLLQSSAREQLLQDLQQRWRSFSGRG